MAFVGESYIDLIHNCLHRMGIDRSVLGYEEQGCAISGSHTFRLEFACEPTVLKVTLADSAPHVVQRARRELAFYRTLAADAPLRVPRVLASCADEDGFCLLLALHEPTPRPAAWTAEACDQAAREMARLHARFWGKTERLAELDWLRRPTGRTTASEIERARKAWRNLGRQERLQGVLNRPFYCSLEAGLARVAELDDLLRSLPLTLCHGDCHMGNLLYDAEGQLVWADWHEVGLGRGPGDLSFFLQRAHAAGSTVSTERMVETYHRQLRADVAYCVSRAAIRRVMGASELRTLLLQWPHYLIGAPTEQVAEMVERINVLAGQLALAA